MKKRLISLLVVTCMILSFGVVQVSAATFEWGVNNSLGGSGDGTSYTLEKNVTFGDATDCLKMTNGSGVAYKYMGMKLNDYNYMMFDAYLASETKETFQPNVQFCKIGEDWSVDEGINRKPVAMESYPTNQWVTVVVDVSEYFDWARANKTGNMNQLIIYSGTLADDEALYFRGSFKMDTYLVAPCVHEDEELGRYVYVSEDLSVTVDEAQISAYGTINDGLTALGAEGGTIYIEGTINDFADIASRGAVTIRGLGGKDAADTNILQKSTSEPFIRITGGDMTFDDMTIKTVSPLTAENSGIFADGYTVNFGKGLKTSGNISVSTSVARGSGSMQYIPSQDVVINGGKFYSVLPLTNYSSAIMNRLGSVNYTFNGGEFNAVVSGSLNSWEWEQSVVTGDINYIFNGGQFHNLLTVGSAHASTLIDGNIIWTINGGTFAEKNIAAGNTSAAKKEALQKNLNNTAVIVNQGGEVYKQIETLTLGSTKTKEARFIAGDEIYILNNQEHNQGTAIVDGAVADYKLHVYHGTAYPVFAKDKTVTVNGVVENYGGDLVGFNLKPTYEGAVPYLNGVALTANEDGLYTIPESADIQEIVFINEAVEVLNLFVLATEKEEQVEKQIKILANNFTDTAKSTKLYIATYEGDKIIGVISEDITIPAAKTVSTLYSENKKVTAEGISYKAFLWDGQKPMIGSKDF